jgi:hypothetical protein
VTSRSTSLHPTTRFHTERSSAHFRHYALALRSRLRHTISSRDETLFVSLSILKLEKVPIFSVERRHRIATEIETNAECCSSFWSCSRSKCRRLNFLSKSERGKTPHFFDSARLRRTDMEAFIRSLCSSSIENSLFFIASWYQPSRVGGNLTTAGWKVNL